MLEKQEEAPLRNVSSASIWPLGNQEERVSKVLSPTKTEGIPSCRRMCPFPTPHIHTITPTPTSLFPLEPPGLGPGKLRRGPRLLAQRTPSWGSTK